MKKSDFFASLHALVLGSASETAQRWIEFAAESVDNMLFMKSTYLGRKPSANPKSKEECFESLLNAIYADFCVVRENYGLEVTREIVSASLRSCCMYPGEIRAAAKCLYNGGTFAEAYDGIALGDIASENPDFLTPLHQLTDRDCGPEIPIREFEVPCGMWEQRVEPGYVLWNGTVLLESERDNSGCYKAVVVDGTYQQTPELYRPVYTDIGQLWAFRQVKPAPENYLATTEISVEGNCNKIDGIINNEAPKPSLRDNLKQCQQEAEAAKPAGSPDRPSQGQDR